MGHIVSLKAGEHIFLKGYDVTRCQDFDHLLSASQQRDLHFFKNLPHERAQVRQALKEKKVAASSDDDEQEKKDTSSRHRSKTSTRPPIVPSRYRAEPSDFVVDLAPSGSDAGSRSQPSHLVVKRESTLIDLTMSDVDATSRTQPPQPIVKREPKIIDLTMSG